MLIENKNGFIDLRNIPKRGVFYFWKESVGCIIPFRYLDVVGELKVVDYIVKDNKLIVEYEGHNYEIVSSVLIRGAISRIVKGQIKKKSILYNGDNYVNLSNIPQKMFAGEMVFDWINSIGCTVFFRYFDKEGEFIILSYDKIKNRLEVEFNNVRCKITTASLCECRVGNIVSQDYINELLIKDGENYVDLRKLQFSVSNGKATVEWKDSIGCMAKFGYFGIVGCFKILNYDKRSQTVNLKYNDSEISVRTGELLNCSLGRLVKDSIEYDNIIYHKDGVNYIDVSNVAKKCVDGSIKLDWKNSIGAKISFSFVSVTGDMIIKDYNNQKYMLSMEYKKEIHKISIANLMSCRLGSIITKYVDVDNVIRKGKNYIDISEVPKKVTALKVVRLWNDSVGCNIPFYYNGVTGVFNVIEYKKEELCLVVKYNGQVCEITTNSILRCALCGVVDVEVNKKIMFENGDFVDLSELSFVSNNVSNTVDWKGSKGKKIEVLYKGIRDTIEILDYDGKKTKLKVKCKDKISEIYTDYLLKGHLKRVVKPTPPLSKTHPHLIQYAVNKEDMDVLTHGSEKLIELRCNQCGALKTSVVKDFARNGMACPACSDGVSYPEKFMQSILNQLSIKYKYQLTKSNYEWMENYRYDFFIDIRNGVFLETHGKQHYESCGWNTVEEQRKIDKIKKELVESNGYSYVELDFRESSLEWCKNSILNSELFSTFDLSRIDWKEAHDSSINNFIPRACRLFNDGFNPKEIALKFNLSEGTIKKYLSEGKKLGLCDYINRIEQCALDKEKCCRLYNGGMTDVKEIANKVSITTASVYRYLRLGTEEGLCNYILPEDKERKLIESVCNLYNQGKQIKDIAEELNVGREVVTRRLKKGNKLGLCSYVTLNDKRGKNISIAAKYHNNGYSFQEIKNIMEIHEDTLRDYLRAGTEKGLCVY